MTDKEGKSLSVLRFATIWRKTDAGLKLASLRDVSEALPPTPHEALEGLSWIVGEWINESSDAKVQMNYRWDESGNFIVGDILITSGDQTIMKSFQRIAWDASQGKYRSWTFDSDGGVGDWRRGLDCDTEWFGHAEQRCQSRWGAWNRNGQIVI